MYHLQVKICPQCQMMNRKIDRERPHYAAPSYPGKESVVSSRNRFHRSNLPYFKIWEQMYDFDAFKKREIEPNYSYLQINELLTLYLKHHALSSSTQSKYGVLFRRLHMTEVDSLCARNGSILDVFLYQK